jgi:hypothetical protein
MRTFVWTFIAVFGGIWVFTKLSAAKKAAAASKPVQAPVTFEGPDVDPTSGAYVPEGNAAGTVAFASAPNTLSAAPQKL